MKLTVTYAANPAPTGEASLGFVPKHEAGHRSTRSSTGLPSDHAAQSAERPESIADGDRLIAQVEDCAASEAGAELVAEHPAP